MDHKGGGGAGKTKVRGAFGYRVDQGRKKMAEKKACRNRLINYL